MLKLRYVALAAIAAFSGLAEAATGDCYLRASTLSVDKKMTVTLVKEYDPGSGEYFQYGCYYLKFSAKRGKAYTVVTTGASANNEISFSVDSVSAYDWERGVDCPTFQVDQAYDGFNYRAYLHSDDWFEEDPSSVTYYICVGGEVGKSVTVKLQSGIQEEALPVGASGNPKAISFSTKLQTFSGMLHGSSYHFTAELVEGCKYKFGTTGGSEDNPHSISVMAVPEVEEWSDPDITGMNEWTGEGDEGVVIQATWTGTHLFVVDGSGVDMSFGIRYQSVGARKPEAHPDIVRMDPPTAVGVSVDIVPGRREDPASGFADPVIDEALAVVTLHKETRYDFQISDVFADLTLEVYAKGNVQALASVQATVGEELVLEFTPPADGEYYVGVCRTDGETTSRTVTLTTTAHRAVAYVSAKGVDASGRGYSDVPYASIQRAIDESEPGSEIRVGAGTFASFTDNGNFYRIIGAGSAKTIIDGKGQNRCATLEGGSTLTGVTLRNGRATRGGGVYAGRLEDCIVEKCRAPDELDDLDSVLTYGEGGAAHGSELVRCVIRNNEAADDGGGLWGGSARNTLFVGNRALNSGGAHVGGAACSSDLSGCTMVGNVSTLVDDGSYGAVDCCSLYNCIVANNMDQRGLSANGGDAVCTERVCFYPASGLEDGDAIFSANPRFVNAKKGDYHLASDSPCINWGEDGYVDEGEKDLEGTERIRKGRTDLGCYESGYTRPMVTVGFDTNGGKAVKTKLSLEMGGTYSELPVPTRAGYRFVGWYSAKTGGDPAVVGERMVVLASHTLYAHWVHISTVTVNGGLIDDQAKFVAEEGMSAHLQADDRTEKGYVFSGWQVSPATATLGEGFDELASACEIVVPSVDVVLTANYIYKPAYLTVEVTWNDPAELGGEGGIEWSVDGKKWYSTNRTGAPVKAGIRTPVNTVIRFRSVDPRWEVLFDQTTIALLQGENYLASVTAMRRGTVSWRAETTDEQYDWTDHGSGTVKMSPADGALTDKGVTLTATPAKNAVFVGWMNEDGQLASIKEKYTVKSGDEMQDLVLVPRFRLKSECTASAQLSFDGSRTSRIMVGVNYMLPVELANDLARPVTFSAKNLPKGLKIDAATGRISGMPTKAGTFKATIVTTSKANEKVQSKTSVFFNVAPLPAWVRGSYTGTVAYQNGEEWDDDSWSYVPVYGHALVSLSIGADGSFSSKGKMNGNAYTVKGTGFLPFDDDAGGARSGWNDEDPSQSSLLFTAAVTIGKSSDSSLLVKLYPLSRETESYSFTTGCGAGVLSYVTPHQNCCGLTSEPEERPVSLWRSISNEPSLANAIRHMTGTYHWGEDDWLTVTVDAKGKVKATGYRPDDGAKIAVTSSLVIDEEGTFSTLLYQASFWSGAGGCGERYYDQFCEMVDLNYADGSDELQPWFENLSGDLAKAMVGVPLSVKIGADWDEADLVFSASGLPDGLAIDAKTGVISGTPTTTASGSVYIRVASRSDKKIFGSVVIPVVRVEAVPSWVVGNYAGAIFRDDLGWGSFAATVSSKGQVSGKMTFGSNVYSFKAGSFDATSQASEFSVTAQATAKGFEPLDVLLTVTPLEFSVGSKRIVESQMIAPYDEDSDVYPAGELVDVMRNDWSDPMKPACLAGAGIVGRHTALFNDGCDGYLTCMVNTQGVVTAAGKMGDGTAFSASGTLVVPRWWMENDEGEVVLKECEVMLYAVPKGYAGGYVLIPLRFVQSDETGEWRLENADRDGLSCNLSAKASTTYGEGAQREFSISGHFYNPKLALGDVAQRLRPLVVQPVLRQYDQGTDDVVEAEPIWMACLDSADENWLQVTVKGNKVTVPKATKGSVAAGFYGKNDAGFTLEFDAKTGIISGSYKLWYDTESTATYTYEGVWVQGLEDIRAFCPTYDIGFDTQDKPYTVKVPGQVVQLTLEND